MLLLVANMSQLPQIIHKYGPEMESDTPSIPDIEEYVCF